MLRLHISLSLLYNVGFNYYDLHIVRLEIIYTKEEGTIHEHCFAKTIYCYNSIVWIMIGSEKLNILLNILFFSKVFVDSNGIFPQLTFVSLLMKRLIMTNRKTVYNIKIKVWE
jgi:hypothetical protein